MSSVSHLTDDQLLSELRSDSLLNRVRRLLASSAARIEQTYMQRHVPNPVTLRRMEFEMAEEMIKLVRDWDKDRTSK